MKKLLLSLVIAFTFGSAIAKTNSEANLIVSETTPFTLVKADTKSLKELGIETTITEGGCTINGHCITCFGRTFCVIK